MCTSVDLNVYYFVWSGRIHEIKKKLQDCQMKALVFLYNKDNCIQGKKMFFVNISFYHICNIV